MTLSLKEVRLRGLLKQKELLHQGLGLGLAQGLCPHPPRHPSTFRKLRRHIMNIDLASTETDRGGEG